MNIRELIGARISKAKSQINSVNFTKLANKIYMQRNDNILNPQLTFNNIANI